jgi:predicted PurR-regulated permease PerM
MIDNIDRKPFTIISGIIVLAAALIVLYITSRFADVIILSLFFTYILYPLDKSLRKIIKTRNRNISAILTLIIVVLVFIAVFVNILRVLYSELSGLDPIAIEASLNAMVDPIFEFFNTLIPYFNPENMSKDLSNLITSVIVFIVNIVTNLVMNFLSNIGLITMKIAVIIFLTFYLLADSENILQSYIKLIPSNRIQIVNKFLSHLDNIYHSLFHVFLFVCLLGGLLGAIGLFLIGVPYPVMWGSIIAIFSLLPIVGPATVYVPIALYYLLVHEWVRAAAILILGYVFMDTLPGNVIRPRLVMQSGQIHPIITLLAFTTAIFVIGPLGIIIGPAAYGFLLALYRTYTEPALTEQLDTQNEDKETKEDKEETFMTSWDTHEHENST